MELPAEVQEGPEEVMKMRIRMFKIMMGVMTIMSDSHYRYVLYAADGSGTFSVSGLHHFVSALLKEQRSNGEMSHLLLLLSPG